ncbi:MAG TPA: diacylglycerol kinase family protein [Blastocatellia bacterium]|jgi:diacylglycerol kinase family enzyme|nr:diacylglycerol kinase family protein [Blastocatellia bacterium]
MLNIGVILNSKAGSEIDPGVGETLAEAFARHGARAEVRFVEGARIRETAREMRDAGIEVIVAGGGDGTVSAVASQLVGYDTRFGVLPFGTLNHFARDLGLPLELDLAIETICSGDSRQVDVGMVNELTFINNSSLGLYPDQVRAREKWRPRVGKWPALIIASLIVLARFPFLRITADFDGKRIKRRCTLIVIGNNEYKLEPRDFIQRERLDGGQLGVYFLKDEGRAGLIRLALHSLVYRLDEASNFESHSAREIFLKTRRRSIRVALDGEVYKLKTPLRYRSVPGGLSVMVPKPAPVAQETLAVVEG